MSIDYYNKKLRHFKEKSKKMLSKLDKAAKSR